MVDIEKCANGDCPLRMNCYRVQAESSAMQHWNYFEYNEETKKCEMFINNNDRILRK